jgi:hypothetical protein
LHEEEQEEVSPEPIAMVMRCASHGLPLPEPYLHRAINIAIHDGNPNALHLLYSLRDSRLIERSTMDLIELCHYMRNKQQNGVRSRIMGTRH